MTRLERCVLFELLMEEFSGKKFAEKLKKALLK
jgi:hypothetical protein